MTSSWFVSACAHHGVTHSWHPSFYLEKNSHKYQNYDSALALPSIINILIRRQFVWVLFAGNNAKLIYRSCINSITLSPFGYERVDNDIVPILSSRHCPYIYQQTLKFSVSISLSAASSDNNFQDKSRLNHNIFNDLFLSITELTFFWINAIVPTVMSFRRLIHIWSGCKCASNFQLIRSWMPAAYCPFRFQTEPSQFQSR